MNQKLKDIDAQILALAQERCRILTVDRNGSSSSEAEIPKTLRESQAFLSSTPSMEQDEFSRSLLQYVAGSTYLASVRYQAVAYLGPQYSYSYSAAAKYFGPIDSLQPVNTIGAVFEEIIRNQASYGVVPIENSTDGRIVDTFTMFIKSPVKICGEVLLPIHHNLLAMCKREEIQEVYSKPQALSQCREWLTNHLPNARWVEVASTAVAAKIAATQPNAAAVASREAGISLGLNIVAASIEDNQNNVTRFAILGNEEVPPTQDDKTSILFQVPHKPGALADVMVLLRDNGINLTWIESFPVPGVNNEYFFFVELEGHKANPNVQKAMGSLSRTALRFDLLGSYPRAR